MRLAIALLLVAATSAQAAVEHRIEGQNRVIKGDTYEAVLAPDGCITNLRVGGVEFLALGVGNSRGAYLFQGGTLRLAEIGKDGSDGYVAKSEVGSIRYQFEPGAMEWTVTNGSKSQLVLFLVFRDDLDAAAVDGAALSAKVLVQTGRSSTWFRDGQRMVVEGSDRLWGPFAGAHQVWDARIEPGAQRTVRFRMGPASAGETAAIETLLDPLGGRELLILSPREYQVVQRRTAEEGELFVSGRLRAPADAVEVRFEGKPRAGRLAGEWRALQLDRATKIFSGRIALPAGGWYRMEARLRRGGKEVPAGAVEHVGVGEVFVGAGQSNSTNCGQEKTKQLSGMVASFSGTEWRLADDPQWGPHDRSGGGSFWPAFGDAMYAHFQVPIGVAVTGHGGTSVNRWQPGGDLFPWMMRRIDQLGPDGFRAVLWHQGESDVHMDADLYYRRLRGVIENSKSEAGWEFPWFVAQVSYHNAGAPRFESTRSAHARLWRDGVAEEGPDTDTLTGDLRDQGGAGIHFSPKGLKKHGEMWAALVAPYVERCLKR